jgi:hypothetical protein
LGKNKIESALSGLTVLSTNEIYDIYGSTCFDDLKWPTTVRDMEQDAQWMFEGFLDCCKVPIICHLVHLINIGKIQKSYKDFAYDLLEAETI